MYLSIKRTIFVFLVFCSLSGCYTSKYRVNTSTTSRALTTVDYQKWGDDIARTWQLDVNVNRAKLLKSGRSLFTFGIINTGVGSVSGAITAGLSDQKVTKGIGLGVSITGAVLGVVQLFLAGNKNNLQPYVDGSSAAIAVWNSSAKDKAAFDAMSAELEKIRKAYPGYGNFPTVPPASLNI